MSKFKPKFNFTKAIEEGKRDAENNKLSLVLLGSSGDGKSYTQGTWGCKALYLYFSAGERHGPKSASKCAAAVGTDLVPYCLDRVDGQQLSADDTYDHLLEVLSSMEFLKESGFKAISLDGATELEQVIRGTTEFKKTSSPKDFTEGPITLSMFRRVLSKLHTLQYNLGVHFCVTVHLNVVEKGQHGEVASSHPSLWGYQVATGLVKQFDDIMVIGQLESPKTGDLKHRFQPRAVVAKTAKNFNTHSVTKMVNFSPRLTGVDRDKLPPTMDPNLAALITLKEGK